MPLAGASTKLLTATGLLLAHGPDARLETRAVAAASRRGVVAGDLFVVGGGDAALGMPVEPRRSRPAGQGRPHVDGLVDAIVAAGVTRIEGSVVGDGRRYDGERYNPAWPQRFIDQTPSARSAGSWSTTGSPPSPRRSRRRPRCRPRPGGRRRPGRHRPAAGQGRRGGRGPVPAGPRAAAAEVTSLASPPVSQIVAEMLTYSDNETAEAALKEIGVATSGNGSATAGKAALTQLLTDAGVAVDGVGLVDGSGLSNQGRLTCRA